MSKKFFYSFTIAWFLVFLSPTFLLAEKHYVLLMGVNNYDNEGNRKRADADKRPYFSLKELRFCSADMSGLGDALIKGKFTTAENIILLTSNATESDKKANIANFNRNLNNICAIAEKDDVVFIAFAGHGLSLPLFYDDFESKDGIEQYLCPMDAEVIYDAKTKRLDRSQLLWKSNIERILQESCKAKVKLLVFDACRDTPAVVKNYISRSANTEIDTSALTSSFRIGDKIQGLFQLFSCSNGEKSYEYEGEINHGVYSHYFIKALQGEADVNKDGLVTLSELQQYVTLHTQEFVINHIDGQQTPNLLADSHGSLDITLALCNQEERPIRNDNSNLFTSGKDNTSYPNYGTDSSSNNNAAGYSSSRTGRNNFASSGSGGGSGGGSRTSTRGGNSGFANSR